MTLAEVLRGDRVDFTPRERRVSRALLANYPRAGLGTAAELAKLAGVSAPTVVRFSRALGYSGFAELQEVLLEELTERSASPVSQFAEQSLAGTVPSGHWLSAGLPVAQNAVSSLNMIPTVELDRGADLLANPQLRISAFGGRYSGLIASYLTLHLEQVRPGVRPQAPAQSLPGAEFVDASRRDVFVVYDFRRYQTSTIQQAALLAAAGAHIICVTDPWLSPVSQVAEVVLPTSIESATPFDSASAAFVLTELLVGAVLERVGLDAAERMRRWDEANSTAVGDLDL